MTWRRRAVVALAIPMVVLLVVSLTDIGSPHRQSVRSSIDYWAGQYDVDVHLARAVAWMESGNNPRVVSSTGARGVMQVQPATWRYTEQLLGTRVPQTTDGNIRIGIAYLHEMLREFDGNRARALAAYYQGPQAVRESGVYASSEHYVATVLALARRM